MAPSATETLTASLPSLAFRGEAGPGSAPESSAFSKGAGYRKGTTEPDQARSTAEGSRGQWNGQLDPALGFDDPTYKYKDFLPVFRNDYKLPPLEPFEHRDPGLDALG